MVILKAILGGLVLFFSFSPFNIWPAAFVSAGLLFSSLVDQNIRIRFTASLLFGLSFFLPLLHWSSTYVGALPWAILALGQSLIFSLIALIFYRKDLTSAISFAGSFTLIEILRMKFPFGGFGWGRIGHTQTEPFADAYPILGITGITFFIVLVATFIVIGNIRSLLIAALTVFVLTLVPNSLKSLGEVDLIGVQGGVEKLGLDFNERAFSVLQRHIDVTKRIENQSDLIIWPENSSDIDPIQNREANRLINDLISVKNTQILVGAVEQSSLGPINSSILFSDKGSIKSRYIKQDLAPFGEYIPLRDLAEYIAPEAKQVRNFLPGDNWVIHKVNDANILPVICFELLDDDHIRVGVKFAEIIVNQTNNATFGRSNQAAQQLQIAQARSAEFGKETFTVSTTGFTAHINNRGEILKKLPQFKADYLEASVMRYEGQTVASRIPSWLWIVFLTLLIGFSRLKRLSDN